MVRIYVYMVKKILAKKSHGLKFGEYCSWLLGCLEFFRLTFAHNEMLTFGKSIDQFTIMNLHSNNYWLLLLELLDQLWCVRWKLDCMTIFNVIFTSSGRWLMKEMQNFRQCFFHIWISFKTGSYCSDISAIVSNLFYIFCDFLYGN